MKEEVSSASAAEPAKQGPLQGIRVVEVTTAILGPVATRILGDQGADVIKIEAPEGDQMRHLGPARHPGMSAMFLGLNRNKRSLMLDLKRPEALAVLRRLVATADVFVHNMRAGAADRLDISYPKLAAINPKLIYASASGYNRNGRNRDKPAFDEVIQGACGVSGLFLRADAQARYAPFVIADKVLGHVLANAIAVALFERERSGLGQEVQVPMFEAMVEFNLLEHFWGRVFDPPLSEAGYTRIFTPERRPFQTRDGYICVTATTDPQWKRLFEAIGRPELARDPRFEKMAQRTFHFDEAFAYVSEALLERTTAEWESAFNAIDIPNGPVNSLEDLFASDYLESVGFFRTYEHPSEGRLVTTNPTVEFSRTPSGFQRPPPRLGEHTREIMQQAGFADAEIKDIERVETRRPS